MASQFQHSSSLTKMIIIGELILVSYLLYTLTVSVYKSYQIDQHILNFKKENDQIAQENREKEADYSYYTSDAYNEKMAKQNLGLVNPGEQVIVIPSTNADSKDSVLSGDNEGRDVAIKPSSNPAKWWRFFFSSPEVHRSS